MKTRHLFLCLSFFVTLLFFTTNVTTANATHYFGDTKKIVECETPNIYTLNSTRKWTIETIGEDITLLVKDAYGNVSYIGQDGKERNNLFIINEDIGSKTNEILDCNIGQYKSLGIYKITHYCTCQICCGDYSYEVTGVQNRTATGTLPISNKTIAVDPDVIEYGTILYIDGENYVAEDCGGGIVGKHIDIYCDSHEEALQKGVCYKEVFVKR